jgi:tetratricopeptide (TPR) repeat protein
MLRKGYIYRILTGISRLFSLGTHFKRINDLQGAVVDKIEALPPSKRLTALKLLPWNYKKESNLKELADRFFKEEEYDDCLESIEELSGLGPNENHMLKEMVSFFLREGNPEKALKAANLIAPYYGQEEYLRGIAEYYLVENKNPKKALEVNKKINLNMTHRHYDKKEKFIVRIAADYWNNQNREEALATIKSITVHDSLKHYFMDNAVVDTYYNEGKYEEVLDKLLSHCSPSKKLELALAIGHDNEVNSPEIALKAIQFIGKNRILLQHYSDKLNEFEALATNLANAFFDSKRYSDGIKAINLLPYEKMQTTFDYHKKVAEALCNGSINGAYGAIMIINQSPLPESDKTLLLEKYNRALDDAKAHELKNEEAEGYFNEGQYEKAFSTLPECSSFKRIELALKLGHDWHKKNELDDAIKAMEFLAKEDLSSSADKQKYEIFVNEIVTSYSNANDANDADKVFEKTKQISSEAKDIWIEKIVEFCIQNDRIAEFNKSVTQNVNFASLKHKFIDRITENYYANLDYKNVFEIIGNCSSSIRKDIAFKIAENCYKNDLTNAEKAIKLLSQQNLGKPEKRKLETIVIGVSQSYSEVNNPEKALQILKYSSADRDNLREDQQKKIATSLKTAAEYYDNKEPEKALKIIEETLGIRAELRDKLIKKYSEKIV